jgi:hypothetical protein
LSANELLAEMAASGSGAGDRLPARTQIQKVRYSHDAMIDLIIENPWVHQNELAAHFGYSPAWISTVMATDMFKARLAQRRDEVIDPALKASLEERFRAVVTKSLQVLQEKLEAPVVPDNLVLRAVELGAKALGLGGNAQAAPMAYPVDHLNNLAGRLLALQARTRGEVQDVPFVEEVRIEPLAGSSRSSAYVQQARPEADEARP